MISHYIDIAVDEHLDATTLFARLIYRIHGYCKARQDAQMAIDFPNWQPPQKMMAAKAGNVMRVLGTDASLGDLLLKTGFMQFLIEGGIAFMGVRKIPDQISKFALLSRNYRIERYTQLLADPAQIHFDQVDEQEIPAHIKEVASEMDASPALMFTMERLMQTLHADKKRCVTMRMQSESTGKPFIMNLNRETVEKCEAVGHFSTYGFSVEGACVPAW
jgi:CRISPR-associated endoribonuclease Cas6/Csy4 subtype I-F